VSENIIEASWEALNDAVNYKLMQSGQLTPSSLSDLAAGVAS